MFDGSGLKANPPSPPPFNHSLQFNPLNPAFGMGGRYSDVFDDDDVGLSISRPSSPLLDVAGAGGTTDGQGRGEVMGTNAAGAEREQNDEIGQDQDQRLPTLGSFPFQTLLEQSLPNS